MTTQSFLRYSAYLVQGRIQDFPKGGGGYQPPNMMLFGENAFENERIGSHSGCGVCQCNIYVCEAVNRITAY